MASRDLKRPHQSNAPLICKVETNKLRTDENEPDVLQDELGVTPAAVEHMRDNVLMNPDLSRAGLESKKTDDTIRQCTNDLVLRNTADRSKRSSHIAVGRGSHCS